MSEVEKYISVRDRIIQLKGDRDVISTQVASLVRDITNAYRDKISKLTEEKDALISGVEENKNSWITKIDSEMKELWASLEATEEKIRFLTQKDTVESTNVAVDREKIIPREGTDIIWLGDLRKEVYLHIILFIAQNRKPVNKYSLVAYGNCALAPFLPTPASYVDLLVNDWDCRCYLKKVIRERPSVDELKTWAEERRPLILRSFLEEYDRVKRKYRATIRKHTLKDFERALTIREVSEDEAPIVCKLTRHDETTILRIYKEFYYSEVGKSEKEDDVFLYIKVAGVTYKRLCRIEQMEIKASGNISFGRWFTVHIEEGIPNEETLFNKENYDKFIGKIRKRLKKELPREELAKLSFSYPKVEWIQPGLLSPEKLRKKMKTDYRFRKIQNLAKEGGVA